RPTLGPEGTVSIQVRRDCPTGGESGLAAGLPVIPGRTYDMRMPRLNIWLPEALHREAKDLHLPLSELAQRAIAAEVERHRKAAALDAYLAELDNELGLATSDQISEAEAWVGKLTGPDTAQRRKPRS